MESQEQTKKNSRDGSRQRDQSSETEEDLMTQVLTGDLVADILRRVGARGLAASRCVCKAWAATVDAHGLLRPHLLPHSLAGIFLNFNELGYAEFFSRPAPSSSSSTGAPDGKKLAAYRTVRDHCNGLLLLWGWVVNPATGWRAPLPPRPAMARPHFFEDDYLAYDPAVAPAHYQVFLIPSVPKIDEERQAIPELALELIDPGMMGSEWPPSRHVLRVFSSATGRWEERTFLREGEAAGTVADMAAAARSSLKGNTACWRGALYVHSRNCDFLIRLSLSDDKYKVIRLPKLSGVAINPNDHLGRSEKGVYYAFFSRGEVRVWILNELSDHKYEWVLKYDRPGLPLLYRHGNRQGRQGGAWTLQDANFIEEKFYDIEFCNNDNIDDTTVVDLVKCEWSSDDDDEGLKTEDMVAEPPFWTTILGFHPFKEIVFLSKDLKRGIAYHLNTSKIQDLGILEPKYYNYIAGPWGLIEISFLYTPCLMPLKAAKDPKKRQ